LRDPLYDLIAYRIFGKTDCMIPDPADRDRVT
jgi:predicted DCC family thiol-disulfide oxidoreductase YuxK